MPARRKIVVPALVALASIALIGTASSPEASAADQVTNALLRGDSVALHVTGKADNTGPRPGHFIFNGIGLTSLATGEMVGTADEDVTCVTPSCSLVDVVTTFNLPEGKIVSQARHTALPDPQRPGWLMTNTRPGGDTLVSTTGVYSGKRGVGRMSGTVNPSGLANPPQSDFGEFDEYFVIDLGN